MARILVIDDDAELLEMLRIALEQRGGHETVLSADSAEGLALAVADPPNLAIVDVMMPDLDGYAVCRQLRSHPETASVPILILTARGQPIDRQAAMDAGADEYLAKPVTVKELLSKVDEALAKGKIEVPSLEGTFVILSLRGGVGVTTLAVNMAAMLAQTGGGSVCLVDLCPSSGHVALQLGLRPEPNWSDMVRGGEINEETVAAHLLEHESGLRVLASPVIPLLGQTLPRASARQLLSVLQQRFQVIFVDTSSILNGTTVGVLEAVTDVVLVVTAEHPAIQTTIGTLRVLRRWPAGLHVIVNQVTPQATWPAAAIGRVLGQAPIGTVPFDPAQPAALRQGNPVCLQNPRAPLAAAVQDLIRHLAQIAENT